ncbi:MAG: hypothetical protein ACK4NE_10330, partial [Albidovulum sp.]
HAQRFMAEVVRKKQQRHIHERFVAQLVIRGGGGTLFALTSIILGGCILLALIFEPRGLAHRWSVLRNAFQIWPFPRN